MLFFSPILLIFCFAMAPAAGQALEHKGTFPAALHEGLKTAIPNDPQKKTPDIPPKQILLDTLYARLAATQDEEEAQGILQRIERQQDESGSATADLLMDRASLAVLAGDQPLAVEILDRILTLIPQWPQAWFRRGSLFVLMDDPQRALADLFQTVIREPRHLQAWEMIGSLYSGQDDNTRALAAYRKALAINPSSSDLKETVRKLTFEVEGRPL